MPQRARQGTLGGVNCSQTKIAVSLSLEQTDYEEGHGLLILHQLNTFASVNDHELTTSQVVHG